MEDLHRIAAYCEILSSIPSQVLVDIERFTELKTPNPSDYSGRLQGRFLSLLSKLLRPKVIVEIGTFTGYATICLSEGLSPGGRIITIESKKNLEEIITSHLDEAGISDRVEMHIGNALDVLPNIDSGIDLVFMDASKTQYWTYFEILIEKLVPGGIIIADNVLWKGLVLQTELDKMALSLDNFNKLILDDHRVENVILPFRDGLNLIRKK